MASPRSRARSAMSHIEIANIVPEAYPKIAPHSSAPCGHAISPSTPSRAGSGGIAGIQRRRCPRSRNGTDSEPASENSCSDITLRPAGTSPNPYEMSIGESHVTKM